MPSTGQGLDRIDFSFSDVLIGEHFAWVEQNRQESPLLCAVFPARIIPLFLHFYIYNIQIT